MYARGFGNPFFKQPESLADVDIPAGATLKELLER